MHQVRGEACGPRGSFTAAIAERFQLDRNPRTCCSTSAACWRSAADCCANSSACCRAVVRVVSSSWLRTCSRSCSITRCFCSASPEAIICSNCRTRCSSPSTMRSSRSEEADCAASTLFQPRQLDRGRGHLLLRRVARQSKSFQRTLRFVQLLLKLNPLLLVPVDFFTPLAPATRFFLPVRRCCARLAASTRSSAVPAGRLPLPVAAGQRRCGQIPVQPCDALQI